MELKGGSTSARTTSSQSFRSSLQQMVGALDETADEGPASTETGKSQTVVSENSVISSCLKGNPTHDETASKSNADTPQSTNIQSTQASARWLHARVMDEQAEAHEAQDESDSSKASVAPHSGHAKTGAVDRPVPAKSTSLKTNLHVLSDAATPIAAQCYQPVITAKTPASSDSRNFHSAYF